MFATEIVNVCIIQPHTSVVCWIFKVGGRYSDHIAEDLCIREEDECCQDGDWVVAKQLCKSS